MTDARRSTDGGVLCWIAARATQAWDFVDRRQMDCWVVTIFTLWVSYRISAWAMAFATTEDRPGLEVAAIIASIGTPWAALQAAVVKFVFDARKGSFDGS